MKYPKSKWCTPTFLLTALISACSLANDLLPLRLPETPKPHYNAPIPAQVSGRVTVNAGGKETGVADVSVSDGYFVTKTDSDGKYSFAPSKSAVFIFVTRPSRYDVVGSWYQPVAETVDFKLRLAIDDESDFTFIHVTDTHVSSDPISIDGLTRFVKELNALRPPPRFVVNSGDLINLSKSLNGTPDAAQEQMRNYVGIMNHLSMPHYNVAGDHADSSYRLADFPRGDHRCGKPLYWEYLGPHFYSFEYGPLHFLSVDNGYHLGKRQINGREYPPLTVQPMHTAWMRDDMSKRTSGTFVVTMSEGDLCHDCPGYPAMAARYDVRFQFIGDVHVVSEKLTSRKPDFVAFRAGGALAGCWWNPKSQRLCPDLNPQGYLIYRLRGGELDHFSKGLDQRVAITSHRVGALIYGPARLEAHVVQPRPNETLEYSFDGENWTRMKPVGRPFYRATFTALIDAASLPEGLVDLHVRSSLTNETRRRQLVVANGKTQTRYTNSATLAFSTAARLQKTPIAPKSAVDVLFNGKIVGKLEGGALKDYSFEVAANRLRRVNTVRFRFEESTDGMNISNPELTFRGVPLLDPRAAAVKEVRVSHWKKEATDWGGFVVGDGDLIASPFLRKQNTFCYVLPRR